MSIRNFVPTIWSAKLFQELDKSHVLVPLCNRDYEGEIKSYGDQVKINAVGDITVSNYAPNVTTITPEQLTAAQTILEINQAKYFAFYIDDVDNAQSKPKIMGEAMRKAAYAIADTIDQYIAGRYGDAAQTISTVDVTEANALSYIAQAAQKLDEKNVPSQGRWMAIPPWFHQKLVVNKIMETDGSVSADSAYTNGFIGRAFGFDFFMSNNLSTVGCTGSVTAHNILAGTNRAISFAAQVVELEAYRPENGFKDAVKGLHVYGAKTVDPNALVRLSLGTSS